MRIETLETFRAGKDDRVRMPGVPHAEWAARLMGRTPPAEVADSPVLAAEVNHSRWVVRCPWCGSAQIVDPSDPRFWCPECDNRDVGGRWVRVRWPDEATRLEIEDELMRRPRDHQRNWQAYEVVEDLRQENRRRGVR